jgi:hypothetical protein
VHQHLRNDSPSFHPVHPLIRAAITAQAKADEWAGAVVGEAAAGSAAAALPTARTGGGAGCCGRHGFAALGVGVSLILSLIDSTGWWRTQRTRSEAGMNLGIIGIN